MGPDDLQGFFDRWMAVVPTPLGGGDRAGGYWWELSLGQVEIAMNGDYRSVPLWSIATRHGMSASAAVHLPTLLRAPPRELSDPQQP